MGNQREIRQVAPTQNLGVAIPIRDLCVQSVSDILAQHESGYFYTYIAAPDEPTSFPNMDGDDTKLTSSASPRFIIQSGGKMRCGYDSFCGHVADIAKHLHDAHFFVGDEEDYIDEFQITDGQLHLQRIHSGGWRALDQFLAERFPELTGE